jgi:hypothetical protein
MQLTPDTKKKEEYCDELRVHLRENLEKLHKAKTPITRQPASDPARTYEYAATLSPRKHLCAHVTL